jgi:hypothetical protein
MNEHRIRIREMGIELLGVINDLEEKKRKLIEEIQKLKKNYESLYQAYVYLKEVEESEEKSEDKKEDEMRRKIFEEIFEQRKAHMASYG